MQSAMMRGNGKGEGEVVKSEGLMEVRGEN